MPRVETARVAEAVASRDESAVRALLAEYIPENKFGGQ